MKRKFTFLTAAFALLAFLSIPLGMWGQNTTVTKTMNQIVDANGYTVSSGSNIGDIVTEITLDDNLTMSTSGQPNCGTFWGTTTIDWRLYQNKGGDVTIAVSDGNLVSVKFTYNVSNNGSLYNGSTNVTSGTVVNTTGTSITLTVGNTGSATNGQVRITAVEVVYTPEGGGTPTCATPTFNPAGGTYLEAQNVTISTTTEGATIYYTTDGTEPTTNGTVYSSAIPVNSTTTIKAMAEKADYYDSSVASATYTISSLVHAGTEADPYSVADAHTAIDAGTGITGVYATGIVSAIPTAYNSTYSNITFNMVDEEGDEVFLQAYRCGGTLASEVAVGDIAVVYGNLTKYGSTYEFAQGCEVISLTHPAVAVEVPTFSPAAGTYADAQNVTISCATEGATMYYTIDGTEPTNASTQYSTAISIESTTTIKAIAYVGDETSTVATATYHINSQANPYTVAQAMGAPEGNGIYVHGFITSITEVSTQYGNATYNISDGGNSTTEMIVYRGKYLNNEGFTSSDQIQVGDEVVVYGNLTDYNGANQMAQGNYIVSLVHPTSTEPSITIVNATFEVEAEGDEGIITVNYENIDDILADIQFYEEDGETAATAAYYEDWFTAEIDEDNNVNYLVMENEGDARIACFKVYALVDDELVYSNLVTINQDAYVAPALDYATLPFAFDGGRADIETTNGLTQDGLDSDYGSSPKLKFNTTGDWVLLHFEGTPGTLSFDIKGNSFSGSTFTVQTSEDGVTYTDLINYTDANFDNTLHSEEFTNLGENVRYIKWIYTEKVQNGGNVALGNIILAEYVAPQPSITVESDVINVDADSHQEFLSVTFVNFQPTTGYAFTCDANGAFTDYSWLVAELDINNSRVRYTISNNEGEARTAYFMVRCGDVDSEMVTVNQAAYVAPTASKYVKVTSMDDLTDGQYLIVYEDGGLAFDGSLETLDASNNTIEVNPNDGEIAVTSETTAAEFTIDVTEGTIKSASGLYIGQTSDANGMKTSATEAYTNTITIDEDGDADVVASGGAYLRYNANSGQERFRYFKSSTYTNQKAIQLYRKEEAVESYELTIEGYADDNTKDGYYLIASPVTVDLTNHDMTTGDFDLYYYDDAQELEWINYEGEDGDFDLIPGKGYLYAKKATDENPSYSFTLTGTPYDGDGEIELATGWNLVGNPFGVEAEISMDYYALTPTAIELIPTEASTNVAPMQGVFVQYTTEDPTVIFMPSETGTNTGGGEKLVMNVNGNRGNVIDRAIVRFGEGRTLSKFQLNPNNTKIYVTEGNQDFAIVRSAAEGEMPVSFKASENGTYTLNIEAENVNMNYLHLIDNMTGADVDLLATPSYSFEARTTDYASRFRLVFNANSTNDNEAETFAYFNGSNWTISNVGEATLQVVDVTGRMVSNETISGNAEFNLNKTPGVYMLRLVNGNSVKTQKIVVK